MNIFISSTFSDLIQYRDIARQTVENAGHRPEMVERFSGVDPRGVSKLLRALLQTCHACILIVGLRRGSGPTDESGCKQGDSYTMIEYFAALRNNVPLFPFFVGKLNDANSQERLFIKSFREDIIANGLTVRKISSVNEFESSLSEILNSLNESYIQSSKTICKRSDNYIVADDYCNNIEKPTYYRKDLYGKALMPKLAKRLTDNLGKGFSRRSLDQYRQFYECYKKIWQTLSAKSQEQSQMLMEIPVLMKFSRHFARYTHFVIG
jgi:hypothetical protein